MAAPHSLHACPSRSACLFAAGSDFNLSGPGAILQALGVLAVTVAVHELGHFVAARSQGIHVTKFSIGFGPVLAKYQVQREQGGKGGH